MAWKQPARGREIARLTPFWAGSRKPESSEMCPLQVQPFQQPEPDEPVKDQEQRDDHVQQPRHDENQNARDQRHDRGNVGNGQGHGKSLGTGMGNLESVGILAGRVPRVETHKAAAGPVLAKIAQNCRR